MLQTAKRARDSASTGEAPPHERYLEAFRWMLQTRIFEEKLTSLYRGGMITGGVYVGRGQEAVSAACGMFLQKGDVFAPLIRDQAGRAAFGEPLLNVTRTYLGSRQGSMRGRDGNIHRGWPETGQLAMISHLGAMIAVVVGKLLAKKMKGEKNFVGLTTIGEGGMQTGATHEGMNIASVEKVPFVLVASNNHFAYSTPNDREFACANLVDRARGYGYEGRTVDGTDLAACLDVIGGAVERARAGGPPQLVVASLLRLAGHGEHDTNRGEEPIAFDSDCREGICGTCSLTINGETHGPSHPAAACQLYMREFKDDETITIEPFRARPFPIIKDLVIDRSALDRIVQAGGFVSARTGSAPEANSIPVPKQNADLAMEAAACIGCGACAAACPNASAMLFTSAKISHLALLPQGQPERQRRVLRMVRQMDTEGFGNCTNTYECEAVCPAEVSASFIAKMNREYALASLRERVGE